MIRSGARRLIVLFAVLVALSLAVAVLGLAMGAGAARSLALGCYVVGALAGFVGFALGSRRVFRPLRGDEHESRDDQRDARAVAIVLMVAGVVLVLIGAAIDPRARLV